MVSNILSFVILTGKRWYHIVELFCNNLVSEVKNVFIYIKVICEARCVSMFLISAAWEAEAGRSKL